MTFPTDIERAVTQAIGSMNFADSGVTSLTPEARAVAAEKVLRALVERILQRPGYVSYTCFACKKEEYLDAAHEVPFHRHGKHLFKLSKTT